MQLSERDYWKRAGSLIDDHGDDALMHAFMRVAELLESGDVHDHSERLGTSLRSITDKDHARRYIRLTVSTTLECLIHERGQAE